MERVKVFCVSAILSMAYVGCLTAQDSLLLSGLSCSFSGKAGSATHCVCLCKKQISDFLPKITFARVSVSRQPYVSYNLENLCICKMLKLASFSNHTTMHTISSADIGYQLKSHAAPCGNVMLVDGLNRLAHLDSSSIRSSQKR